VDRRELLAHHLAAAGIEVATDRREKLLWLLDELLRWNRRINLTAITDPEEGIEKHLVDSLTLLPFLATGERLLDLGSGGGFPGLPLKIVRPDLEVVSVDAVGKKISFQRHVARHLKLSGFTALHCRAEDLPRWSECRQGFDLVVSRAFADLATFATLARPLLRPTGRIMAMKGPEGRKELEAARGSLEKSGLCCRQVDALRLPVCAAERTLIVLEPKKKS
jgi:16S rRNA (guanine527-N7)-methyltransferase